MYTAHCRLVTSHSKLLMPRHTRLAAAIATVMGLLQLRYEHDSSTIRVRFEHDSATTRYEVFRALAYEIVYENQW